MLWLVEETLPGLRRFPPQSGAALYLCFDQRSAGEETTKGSASPQKNQSFELKERNLIHRNVNFSVVCITGVAKMAFWGKPPLLCQWGQWILLRKQWFAMETSADGTRIFDGVSLFWNMAGSHIFAKAAWLNQRCYSLFCCLVGGSENGFTFSWSPRLLTPTASECGRPGLQGPGKNNSWTVLFWVPAPHNDHVHVD